MNNRTLMFVAVISASLFGAYPAAPQEKGLNTASENTRTGDLKATQSEEKFHLPVDLLSSQDDRPFLSQGGIMGPERPRWDEFAKSINQFSSTEDCLDPPADETGYRDLADIDWSLFMSHRDVEVCLFRIFDSLNNQDLVRDWLKQQGYRLTKFYPRNTTVATRDPEFVPSEFFEAYILRDIFAERVSFINRSLFQRLFYPESFFPTGYGLHISFAQKNRVVNIGSQSKGR